jgi:DNA-binding transcriptional MerR regulator
MQTFTTRVAAEVAGVHQQTVIRWAKEGFLKPSVPRRKYEPRKYTERDLAALMIAKEAFEAGFYRLDVALMVNMAQKGDEKQQRNAAVFAVKGLDHAEGFVHQCFLPNVKIPEEALQIESWREYDLLLQQVSFYDIVQKMLGCVRETYVNEKLAVIERAARKALEEEFKAK